MSDELDAVTRERDELKARVDAIADYIIGFCLARRDRPRFMRPIATRVLDLAYPKDTA